MLGNRDAPVPIVVFADFQCPYCARAQAALRETIESHQGLVKVLFRHLPLETIHPFAWKAGIASECAAKYGAFESFHDLLYSKQDSIGRIPWVELAMRVGVNPSSFNACFEDERSANALERDVILARQLGIDRTPTFIVGDEMYTGVPPTKWLNTQIARELRRHGDQGSR